MSDSQSCERWRALGPSDAGSYADDSETLDDEPDRTASIVRDDLEHATHVLRALVAFENVPAARPQSGALRDELELIRRRVLAALAMRHRTEGFNRVAFQLAQQDPGFQALALEWLDVTLTGTERAAVALLEPRLSDRNRFNALARTFPLRPLDQQAILLDLVEDRDDRWRRPWIKACALYIASATSDEGLEAVTAATVASLIGIESEDTRIVHETLAGIQHRRLDPD